MQVVQLTVARTQVAVARTQVAAALRPRAPQVVGRRTQVARARLLAGLGVVAAGRLPEEVEERSAAVECPEHELRRRTS